MTKIAVVLEVDEELVKKVSGKSDLEDAIITELGWLQGSGMRAEAWEVAEKEPEQASNKIEIDLGFTRLVASKGVDPNFPEVDIYLVDKEGVFSQDLAVVGRNYHVEHGEIVHEDNINIHVYSDKDNEDYTHGFVVGVYEPDMEKTKEGPEKNIKIKYLYRDADNYKTYNECVIKGVLNEEQKQKILDCLHEGQWFIPSQVGLEEQRNWEIDLEVDHPWFELEAYGFSETIEAPTADVTAEELVAAFEKAKGNWDEFSWLNGVNMDDELEEEIDGIGSLEDKISDAKNRQGDVSGKVEQRTKSEISL